jgi:hypothetical protein
MKRKICSRSSSGRSDQDGVELALLILILQKKYVQAKSACYFSVLRIRIQAILNIPAAPAYFSRIHIFSPRNKSYFWF